MTVLFFFQAIFLFLILTTISLSVSLLIDTWNASVLAVVKNVATMQQ
jgi:hypothetical protein